MNETLKTIATKYSIDLDQIPSILDELNINPNNPNTNHINQFEKACHFLKEGQDFDEAIANAVKEQSKDKPPSLNLEADTIILDDDDDEDDEQEKKDDGQNSDTVERNNSKIPTFDLLENEPDSDSKISVSPNLQLDLNGLVPTDVLNKHLDSFSNQITNAIIKDIAIATQAERQRIATYILEKVRKNLISIVKSENFKQQFQAAITKDIMPKEVVGNHEYEFHVARQLVIQQLIFFVQENERAIKIREEAKKLKEEEIEQKLKARRVFHQEMEFWLGSFLSIFLILIIGLLLGIIFGLNIPDGVGCTQRNFLCQWLRLRQPKVELEL